MLKFQLKFVVLLADTETFNKLSCIPFMYGNYKQRIS